jgi:hypothetical protein
MLKRQRVTISAKNIVPHIFNYDGANLRPFEKLTGSCQETSQLLATLQSLFVEGDR